MATGYFADDSMIRRVMRKRAVGLTYGLRALVIGAVNPLLYVGTAESTEHRDTPYTRLALTGKLFEAVFFGSTAEADRALEFTGKKHKKVVGVLPEDAGEKHPAGSPYSAYDPHLSFMTMAFTFDSAEVMYDLLVRRLTDGEREGLYQDYLRWGELFGMPRAAAPPDYPAFREYFDGYLASDELFLTDEARQVGNYLCGHVVPYPQPVPARQVSSAYYLLVQGSLPPRIRRMYGIEWKRADELAFRGLAQSVRNAHSVPSWLVPRPVKTALNGPSAPVYRLITEQEQQLARAGKRSMPAVDPRPWRERARPGGGSAA
ncbi:oxygenase MpaB family protein [Nocardia carnea]|uniref:oxygenase MpaB family protein n=1 Tax=Nocardia carnea TaxID=37328 RepID=UPI002456D3A4|nr:oxygenase MpaB family protein [Nocardia carnea]